MSTPDPGQPWPPLVKLEEPWPVLHGPEHDTCFVCGLAVPLTPSETVPHLPHLGYAHPSCYPHPTT